MWICEKSQSDPAITGVENKAFVIAEQPKFKFVRYSGVRLAGGRLEKRQVQQGFRCNGVRYSEVRLYCVRCGPIHSRPVIDFGSLGSSVDSTSEYLLLRISNT